MFVEKELVKFNYGTSRQCIKLFENEVNPYVKGKTNREVENYKLLNTLDNGIPVV